MKPSNRLKILFLLLLAAVLAFVFLDFHLAKSSTNSSHNWTRASSQAPQGYQTGVTQLYIAPGQNDPLSRSLAEALFQQAEESDYFLPVLLDSMPQEGQYPVVLVAVSSDTFFWTPFYAKSTLNAEFAYSNFRALATLDDYHNSTLPAASEQLPIEGGGNEEQVDQSFGLFSIAGYRHLACNLAAQSILADLEQMVQVK